jgi:malate synthase
MALPAGVQINAPVSAEYATILTPEALELVAKLHRAFEPRRKELLKKRVERQARIDAGEMPDFLPETKHIREGDWKIAPLPKALECRRVEITGPVEAKMIINAYNSGADSYMTDFEDSNSPKWDNQIQGQVNLYKAIRRQLSFKNEAGKEYKLNDKIATLQIRPRGWHLDEKHVLVDGQRVSGGIFDFRAGVLPQRQGAGRARRRPLLLPAEDGKPSRSPPVERDLLHGAGPHRHAARHHQGHGAGGNHPRHLRDGRNPL